MNYPPSTAEVELAALPGSEELREISAKDGVDAATTLLYQALLYSQQHGWFIKQVQSLSQETKPSPPPPDVELAIENSPSHHPNAQEVGLEEV